MQDFLLVYPKHLEHQIPWRKPGSRPLQNPLRLRLLRGLTPPQTLQDLSCKIPLKKRISPFQAVNPFQEIPEKPARGSSKNQEKTQKATKSEEAEEGRNCTCMRKIVFNNFDNFENCEISKFCEILLNFVFCKIMIFIQIKK